MKAKIILLVAAAAVVTVSFASVNRPEVAKTKATEIKAESEPVGGFVIEDKL